MDEWFNGHLSPQMIKTTVHNEMKKRNLRKARQIQCGLNHGGMSDTCSLNTYSLLLDCFRRLMKWWFTLRFLLILDF